MEGDSLEIGKEWKREIDLLFIDSTHEEEHCGKELELYLPWVKKNGKIVLHDVTLPEGNFGVRRAVINFLRNHPEFQYREFSSTTPDERAGLGILEKRVEQDQREEKEEGWALGEDHDRILK